MSIFLMVVIWLLVAGVSWGIGIDAPWVYGCVAGIGAGMLIAALILKLVRIK